MHKQVNCIELIGGEPFLHPEFNSVISRVLNTNEIKRIEITTNAMVPINDETVQLLQNRKVTVLLSEYGKLNRKPLLQKVSLFREKGINFKIISFDYWLDFGCPNEKQKYANNVERYKRCDMPGECRVLYKGNLFVCAFGPYFYETKTVLPEYNIYGGSREMYDFWSKVCADLCVFCRYERKRIAKGIQLKYDGIR